MKSSARSIQRRLKSVRSIGQLTRAMKTVAVSKYNRSLSRLTVIRPYQAQMKRLAESLGMPAGESPSGQKALYVAVTANRGLCGTYNNNLWSFLKDSMAVDTRRCDLILCGQWGVERGREQMPDMVLNTWPLHDLPSSADADALAQELERLWKTGNYVEILFVSQSFRNILNQAPQIRRLFPLSHKQGKNEGLLLLPGREQIETELVARSLRTEVYEILLSAATGAHGAMLMAMRTATDNAENMGRELERTLNHLRQTSVTTEVLELARGSTDIGD